MFSCSRFMSWWGQKIYLPIKKKNSFLVIQVLWFCLFWQLSANWCYFFRSMRTICFFSATNAEWWYGLFWWFFQSLLFVAYAFIGIALLQWLVWIVCNLVLLSFCCICIYWYHIPAVIGLNYMQLGLVNPTQCNLCQVLPRISINWIGLG